MQSLGVVISGMGVVSACGKNIPETLDNLGAGIRNYSPVSLFETKLDYPVFEVKGIGYGDAKTMRTLELAFIAAGEAMEESGLKNRLGDLRIGVCMGTTIASQLNDFQRTDKFIIREIKNAGE